MEKSLFEQKISEYIEKEEMLRDKSRVLVTVSGGADSVALLLVLSHLGYDCIACHCNFHLRGEESNRDEAFVKALTSRLGIACEFIDFDVERYRTEHKVSVEVACRELRYQWFGELCERRSCEHIAVAHHADDNIETFFLNLLRGSGITGLAGIKPVNGNIIRPLLCVRRKDIEDYLAELGETFVTDSTNLESEYSRNKVRNIIMPTVRECFPGADEAIIKSLKNLYNGYQVYRAGVDNELEKICRKERGTLSINLKALAGGSHPATLLHEALNEYNFSDSQQADMLATETVGAIFSDGRFIAERRQEDLIVWEETDIEEETYFTLTDKELPHGLTWETVKKTADFRFEKSPATAYFSEEILGEELTLRHWRKGDRFMPFGMKGSKKVSDFFSDEKLSAYQKRNALLLTCRGKILWIAGYRTTSLFAVDKSAERIVVMRCPDMKER